MNKPKKCFVLCSSAKCSKITEHTEVYKCLEKEMENSKDIVLLQDSECQGECPNGPYLNIIPDYIGYSEVKTEDISKIIEDEIKKLSNPSNYINKSIKEECYQGKQWKMFTTFCIDEQLCKGCTLCKKVCPAGAINGQVKKVHEIEISKCIKCGKCMTKCKFNAIKMLFISNGVKALRCINCGQLIGTVATRDYLKKKLNGSISRLELCNNCRQVSIGKVLRRHKFKNGVE
ncbi:MAG: 4Fe-4S binding protein [Syntrophomonas sp.]